ncbi:rab-like protein 6, partial [Salvelinus sp. IW2-2015]|uniref:rab-like protein 6 n=1 Tax=Salvelinus sp. IW2-2015 TaxID=2691554 RepID=UPI0038D3B34A
MVAGYQDELDPDDKELPLPLPNTLGLLTSKDFTMSSDEEEVEAQPPPISPPVHAVTQDDHLDLDSDSELKKPGTESIMPRAMEPHAPEPLAPAGQLLENTVPQVAEPITLTLTSAPAVALEQPGLPRGTKGGTPGVDSDSDPGATVAEQMLSFVMDDLDFESEEEAVIQKITKVA